MPNNKRKVKIESLQQQLEELKVIYEELSTNDKDAESLKPIKNQILQLEKAIREYLSKH